MGRSNTLTAEASEVEGVSTTPATRTLHLVDADNLLGDPSSIDPAEIRSTFRRHRFASQFAEGDLAAAATGRNGRHVLEVELAWPGACHRRRSGADGADLELIDQAEWAASSGRFDRVVIASGDRIFIRAFELLRAAEIDVLVVARARSLSAALLARAFGNVRYLPSSPNKHERYPVGYRPSSGDDSRPMGNNVTAGWDQRVA